MKSEYLIPTQKSKANLMVLSIFAENGILTKLFSVKVKNSFFDGLRRAAPERYGNHPKSSALQCAQRIVDSL